MYERTITPEDIDNIWELFFGSRWGLDHIAQHYHTKSNHIAEIIDAESARRWREKNKGKSNRLILGVYDNTEQVL